MDYKINVMEDTMLDGGVRKVVAETCGMVCSSHIEVTEKDGTVLSVKFTKGCDGNTKGVAALASGMDARKVICALSGIDCRGRGTSCPDQLARLLAYITGA